MKELMKALDLRLLLLVALPPAARGQYDAFSYPACTGPNQ